MYSGLARVGLILRPEEEKDLGDSLAELYGGEGYSRISKNHSSNINYVEFVDGLETVVSTAAQAGGVVDKFIQDLNIIMKESNRSLEEVIQS